MERLIPHTALSSQNTIMWLIHEVSGNDDLWPSSSHDWIKGCTSSLKLVRLIYFLEKYSTVKQRDVSISPGGISVWFLGFSSVAAY